jgi:hypothetical protein
MKVKKDIQWRYMIQLVLITPMWEISVVPTESNVEFLANFFLLKKSTLFLDTLQDIFNPVQYRDAHISTCFNKDTCDLFMLCILSSCQLFIIICAHYSLLSFIHFVHCSTLSLFCCSILFFINSFVLPFVVHYFEEKSAILILNCVQIFWSRCSRLSNLQTIINTDSINIIQQTPPTLS